MADITDFVWCGRRDSNSFKTVKYYVKSRNSGLSAVSGDLSGRAIYQNAPKSATRLQVSGIGSIVP